MSKGAIWISGLALAAAAAGGAWWWLGGKGGDAPRFRTATVEKGDIQVSVTATGTLQALVTVMVGTQVSGPIASLHADFNSEVRKGQVIARLDTTLLIAALQDARSNLARVSAQEHQAALELKRTQALFDRSLVSQAELDAAVAASRVAAANLASAKSQVDRARINLRYATITSPIDGTVLSRAVEMGQTVAASFNSPTLFTIAGDLREMEVKAAVDEADIGKVSAGQRATFTVDAFPEAVFHGTVQQVRLEPKVDQNVVTYDVVIRVPNPDKKLMPGMTANLTISVDGRQDVLLVPAAALRFRPPREGGTQSKESGAPSRDGRDAGGEGDGRRVRENGGESTRQGGQERSRERNAAADSGTGDRASGDSALAEDPRAGGGEVRGRGRSRAPGATGSEDRGRGRVYLLVDGKPSPVRVKTGLSDGSRTEVEGDLKPGANVITGLEGAGPGAAGQGARPFGLQPQQGGRRRGF